MLERIVGWFVDWDSSVPFHYVWTDLDTRHCTYWMWRCRLNGWLVCPIRGHQWVGVNCTVKAHNECMRCFQERGDNR